MTSNAGVRGTLGPDGWLVPPITIGHTLDFSFPIPNPPIVTDIDFSEAYKYIDFRNRSIPVGATLKNAAGCVDYHEADNTWTVRAADSPAWLGRHGLMFQGGNFCNFAGPIEIGANANGSCAVSGSGELQADRVTGDCPTFTSNGAGDNFVDYLVSPSAVTVPSGTVQCRANVFAFLYKPLSKLGQAKVRIRATSPSTATPDTEEMVIDNTHSSLVVGKWHLMTNAHPAVSTKLAFTNGLKQLFSGSGAFANTYFSGANGASYCVDLNTVTLACIIGGSRQGTVGWTPEANTSADAPWPTVLPQRASMNIANGFSITGAGYPQFLSIPVSDMPANDICGYFEGFIHRGLDSGALARVYSLHYNDGSTTGATVQGIGFHPGGQGTSNFNTALTHLAAATTETYPSTQELARVLAGTVVPIANRSDFVYLRLFWRKNSTDGLKIFCNGAEMRPTVDQPTLANPFVSPLINRFLFGMARNFNYNPGSFIASQGSLWKSIPFTDEEMRRMTTLTYETGGIQ